MNVATSTKSYRTLLFFTGLTLLLFGVLAYVLTSYQPIQHAITSDAPSVELGLAEVSPLGEAGGYAVPASGSSGTMTLDLEFLDPNTMTWRPNTDTSATNPFVLRFDQSIRIRYRTSATICTMSTNINPPPTAAATWQEREVTEPTPGNTETYRVTCGNGTFLGGKNIVVSVPPPPTVAVQGYIDGSTTPTPTNTPLRPSSQLEIRWTPSGVVDSCTGSSPLTVTSPNPDSNIFAQLGTVIEPGVPRTFSVQCTGPGGTGSGSITYQVPLAEISFTVNPGVVRIGQTSTFNWTISTPGLVPPYDLNCTINGGGYATPYQFQIQLPPSSSISSVTGTRPTGVIRNGFVNRLTCTEPISGTSGAFSENLIEVIPSFEEI